MDFTKMSREEYMKKEPEVPDMPEAIINHRHEKSFHRQMLDVWGEVDGALALYDKWKKKKATKEDVLKQLESVHNCCYVVYSDSKATEGAKWALKFAEWELYDFVLWDNELKNSRKSVTLWFDEWCYNTTDLS